MTRINFSFCTDSWDIGTAYCEQSHVETAALDWQHHGLNDSQNTSYAHRTETMTYSGLTGSSSLPPNATTTIHGLYAVASGTAEKQRHYAYLAPFEALDLSMAFWSVDIHGSMHGEVWLEVNDAQVATFDENASACSNRIPWNQSSGLRPDVQNQINNMS